MKMSVKQSSITFAMLIWAVVLASIALLLTAGAEGHVVAEMKIPSNSGVPDDATAVLKKILADAAKRQKRIVLHPPGGTQSSRDFRRARAAQLVEQIQQIQRETGVKVATWVGDNLPEAYREGKDLGTQQAIEAGIRPAGEALQGSFNVIDVDALKVLAQDTAADLLGAVNGMSDRSVRVLRQTAQEGLSEADINKILAGGIIDGTPRETIRALKDALVKVHGETVPVIDKNGDTINFDAGYYAELVARTKTREASVQARHNRLEEVGLDLVAIVGRVSDNFCTAFLGQVFSLSGNHPKYPPYDSLPGGGPPFHPNCSKSTRPFVEALATKSQLDQAEGVEDAPMLLGMETSKAQRAFKDLQLKQQVQASLKKRSA